MSFFVPREFVQLQILSKEFYNKWISQVQTRVKKLETPFIFYFTTKDDTYATFYCLYDLNTGILQKHISKVNYRNCIQVISSLYIYDQGHQWCSLTDLHSVSLTHTALSLPIFSERRFSSMANFVDELIFVIGGIDYHQNKVFADVYCYEISTDQWTRAPAMDQGRFSHLSFVLGNQLYVCGGRDENSRQTSSIKRMLIDARFSSTDDDEVQGNWETLQISNINLAFSLIVPRSSREILIFGSDQDQKILRHSSTTVLSINPEKQTCRTLGSELDLGTKYKLTS